MTYFLGFTSHQPCHAKFERIHHDSQETKPCHVENDTKTVNRGFLSTMGCPELAISGSCIGIVCEVKICFYLQFFSCLFFQCSGE